MQFGKTYRCIQSSLHVSRLLFVRAALCRWRLRFCVQACFVFTPNASLWLRIRWIRNSQVLRWQQEIGWSGLYHAQLRADERRQHCLCVHHPPLHTRRSVQRQAELLAGFLAAGLILLQIKDYFNQSFKQPINQAVTRLEFGARVATGLSRVEGAPEVGSARVARCVGPSVSCLQNPSCLAQNTHTVTQQS